MIKSILLLSIISLLSISTITLAEAQTPPLPYIELDQPEYFYGDVIQVVGHFETVADGYTEGRAWIDAIVSQDVVMVGTDFPIDMQTNTMNFSVETISMIPFEHGVFPHDGVYTLKLRYVFDDPTRGLLYKYATTDFEYNRYDYNPTERMDALEGDVTTLQQDVSQFNEHITQMNADVTAIQQDVTQNQDGIALIDTGLTIINGTLNIAKEDITNNDNDITTINNTLAITQQDITTNQLDIIDLQNRPNEVLETIQNMQFEIDALNNKITALENNPTTVDLTSIENDIVTLQLQQVPTNAELQTSIDSIDNDIMMMGLDVSSIMNDVDDGLWPRVVELQTANTDNMQDISQNGQNISNLKTKVDAIVAENSTPQDVEQNLRMDGIESDLQNTNSTLTKRIDETDERQFSLFQLADVTQQTTWDNAGRIITVETDVTGIESDITQIQSNVSDNFDMAHANNFLIDDANARHTADVQRLENIDGKLWTDMILGKEGHRDNQDKITTLETGAIFVSQLLPQYNDAITILQGNVTGLDGQLQTLTTDLDNIQISTSPHDDQQNLRLSEAESNIRTLEMQINDSILPAIQALGMRMAAAEQSMDGFINEHIDNALEHLDIWNELDHKQNVLGAQ